MTVKVIYSTPVEESVLAHRSCSKSCSSQGDLPGAGMTQKKSRFCLSEFFCCLGTPDSINYRICVSKSCQLVMLAASILNSILKIYIKKEKPTY